MFGAFFIYTLMRYLKLFEDYSYSEDLPYVQISTTDFSEVHNGPHKMIKLDDYDFNFLNRFIKTIPNSLIERKEDKRLTANQEGIWYFEHIEISFSNIRYSHIRVYKTETNFYTQIFEPIRDKDNNWEFNHYKLDDIYDVVLFIKDKLKLYNKHYSLTESALAGLKNEDETIESINNDKYNDLKINRIYIDEGMLGDRIYNFIHKRIGDIFNHNDFRYEHSLKHITIYENKNTTIAFYINLLEDDYYLVDFKPSKDSYLFVCDGVKGLLKLIKGQYEQFQKRKPKLYYEINQIAFDYPKKNLTIDGEEVIIDNNSNGELEKLETYLNINHLDIRKVGLFNYQISIKDRNYFECFYTSEYNWWCVRFIKPNLSSDYFFCVGMEGLKELIEDKIKGYNL